MLEHLEQQKKLTINQWKIFAAATIGDMLDFFDFLLIAFGFGIHCKGLASDLWPVGGDTAVLRGQRTSRFPDLGLGR